MKKDITLLITTYNRKKRLIEMLKSIEIQGHFGEYELLIVDNCSPDYNWKEILSGFDKTFSSNIHVVRRNYNCGQSCNLASCFQYVKTKWVLTLGDDDEITNGSIEQIFKDIQYYDGYAAIRYTIEGYPKHNDSCITSIEEFNEYYHNYKWTGDLIFLTMLYNMDVINPFLSLGTSFSYTYIGYLFPVLEAIANGKSLRMSSFVLSKYKKATTGTGWNKLTVLLGFATILDVPLMVSYSQKIKLLKNIMIPFSFSATYRWIIAKETTKKEKAYLFNKFYYSLYKPISNKRIFLHKVAFILYYYCNIDLCKIKDVIKGERITNLHINNEVL